MITRHFEKYHLFNFEEDIDNIHVNVGKEKMYIDQLKARVLYNHYLYMHNCDPIFST